MLFILFIKFPGPSGEGTQAKINIYLIYFIYSGGNVDNFIKKINKIHIYLCILSILEEALKI